MTGLDGCFTKNSANDQDLDVQTNVNKLESVLDNTQHNILWDFENQIQDRKSNLM